MKSSTASTVFERRKVCGSKGFTLIELLVVMALIALLATIAAPRYLSQSAAAKEAVLRQNLQLVRDAIDKHYTDRGQYPESLQALIEAKYLKQLPMDPMLDRRDAWVPVPMVDTQGKPAAGVHDVQSAAVGRARDGSEYRSW